VSLHDHHRIMMTMTAAFVLLLVVMIIVFAVYRNHLKNEAYKEQYAMVDITQLNTATVKKSMIDYEDLKSLEPVGDFDENSMD
jgi:heme/copper-type cytochrome/quinol oxidase subunit 2